MFSSSIIYHHAIMIVITTQKFMCASECECVFACMSRLIHGCMRCSVYVNRCLFIYTTSLLALFCVHFVHFYSFIDSFVLFCLLKEEISSFILCFYFFFSSSQKCIQVRAHLCVRVYMQVGFWDCVCCAWMWMQANHKLYLQIISNWSWKMKIL